MPLPLYRFLVRCTCAAVLALCCTSSAWAQYAEQTGGDNPFDGITVLSSSTTLDALAGDFDTDGDADLLSFDGSVERYFENDGSGMFTERTGTENPFDAVGLAFGTRGRAFVLDVDDDGDVDVVHYRPSTGTFAYVENTDGSTFAVQTGTDNPFDGISVSGNQTTVDAVFGDFDTDDDADLLVFDGSSERFYQNNGSGVFSEQTGTGNPFNAVASAFWTNTTTLVADFDGDGDIDLAARDGSASGTTDWLYVENTDGTTYADRSGGTFPLDNIAVEATVNSASVIAGDFNVDGSLDLLAFDGSTETFFAGDGMGTYTARTGADSPFDGVNPALQVLATTIPVNVNPMVDDDVDILFGDNNTFRFIERTGDGIIPVELAGFTARMDGNTVRLTWRTLSETNNAGFDVQRRIHAASEAAADPWTTVHQAQGAGTTAEPQRYRFTDTSIPFSATSLSYRLRQVDVDGTETLSDEVYLRRDGLDGLTLRPVSPNPTRGSAVVEFGTPDTRRVTIQLFDVMGRHVRTVFDGDASGRASVTVRADNLASGLYFIRLQSNGHMQTQRFFIVH